MKIAVVGAGYVGLVSGACFAEMGVDVCCVDVDEDKIKTLKKGELPIYEPHLQELVANNVSAGRLKFFSNLTEVLNSVEIVFITVGTQLNVNGETDTSHVLDVARVIGKHINNYVLVVVKSTVPVGMSQIITATIKEQLNERNVSIDFDVASNPEFLREGSAVNDFMRSERIVVGANSDKARQMLASIYKPILSTNNNIIFMDVASAEMAKYASNAMLATRISLMNEFANFCEVVGANIDMVEKVLATDSRIGAKYLRAGCGYGGSCFPKDISSLIKIAQKNNMQMQILSAVEKVNAEQKSVLFKKFKNHFGDVKGRRVAVWGLAFKPQTNDMRQAPALSLIKDLLKAECEVSVYDPVAMKECRRRIGDVVKYCGDIYKSCVCADAIFHITEWKEFCMADWSVIKELANDALVLIDGRNSFNSADLCGIKYMRIG